MKLSNLLPYLNENNTVFVTNGNGILTIYDGKDSIGEKYNDWIVCENGIIVRDKIIWVMIREEV